MDWYESAFNGFGIYKLEIMLIELVVTKQKIEAVIFYNLIKNEDIKKNEERLEMKFNKYCVEVDCEHRYFHFDAINKNDV